MTLEQIENKFKEYYKINCDLSIFPITQPNLKPQQDKERSKKIGEVFTPIHIVDEMISLISPNIDLKVMDLCAGLGVFGIRWLRYLKNNNTDFNLEDCLSNITFLELDNSNCNKLKEIFQTSNIIQEDALSLKNSDVKYNIVFSNPPFNKNMDLKILKEIFHIADEFIVVHPSTWILDNKKKYKLFNDFRDKISSNIKYIKIFNANKIFDIRLNAPISITHIDLNHKGYVKVSLFDEFFETFNIYDVTKFGTKWFLLVKDFANKLASYCELHSSVDDHSIDVQGITNGTNSLNGEFYCQSADIIGTPSSENKSLGTGCFYTILLQNPQNNLGIRKNTIKNSFKFTSENERKNFLLYCQTDFARFCIALLKNNTTFKAGEMALLPWLDFSEEWDDEKLFEKFEVSQELQDYIREFLPDFHGIRK